VITSEQAKINYANPSAIVELRRSIIAWFNNEELLSL
jgi:hypothetical protein